MKLILAGNPNSGKTTLFNNLTKLRARVGNFSGVTVDAKTGFYHKNKSVIIEDLPGAYSLNSMSDDERVVLNALTSDKPDGIIAIIDGTHLERSLYFTCELINLGFPVTVAVNFYDDLIKNGVKLDLRALSKMLGVPVVEISAKKGFNVDKLVQVAIGNNKKPDKIPFENIHVFTATVANGVGKNKKTKAEIFTDKLDKTLTGRWGFLFLGIALFITFYVSDAVGGFFSKILSTFFNGLAYGLSSAISSKMGSEILADFICDGILRGVFTVIEFLPQIVIVFAFASFFEYTGYTARIAFITDRLFRKIGLSGKMVIPLMVGCGCSVTGIMASRIIENDAERKRAVVLTPFMPCGAKLVVINWIASFFFKHPYLVTVSIYFISLVVIILLGWIFKKTRLYGSGDSSFLLEMPTYRMPTFKDIIGVIYDKVRNFIIKAGTVIVAMNVTLWLLGSFNLNLTYCGSNSGGILKLIGKIIYPIFIPLGFSGWEAAVAVISGIFAREAVVSSLSGVNLAVLFKNLFSAYGFLLFICFYPPCVSACVALKSELGKKHKAIFPFLLQFFVAYLLSLAINLVGIIYRLNIFIFFLVLALFLLCFLAFCVKIAYAGRRNKIKAEKR